jgi:hypothetical protein
VLLHDAQELDNDLGGRSDQNLALAGLLGVVDGLKRIIENGSLDHFGGWRFSNRRLEVRYLLENYMLAFMGLEHGECPHAGKRVLQLGVEERSVSRVGVASSLS